MSTSPGTLSAEETPYRLSMALVPPAAAGGALTVWLPGVLTGPPAMNGSARGTAAVMLVLALPLLVLAARRERAAPAPAWAVPIWAGALGYLLYNAVMLVFATPFNRLFLLYVATLALALWSLVTLLVATLERGRCRRVARPRTDRPVAAFVLTVVGLNLVAWLGAVVPAAFAERPTRLLDGTGLTTNPVYVQDLAFWLPALALAAVLLWRGDPRGWVLTGAGLVYWTLESVGVAVDQWFGHRADPASTVVSLAAVWMFAVLAVVTAVVTVVHLRAGESEVMSADGRYPRR